MDCKKTPSATRTFSPLIFFFLGIFFAFGQSDANKKLIQSTYNKHQIFSLVTAMKAEYRSNEAKINQLLKTKAWKRLEKQKDGTVVELKDIGTDGTPLFYTTLNDPSKQVSRANTLYSNGLLNLGLDGYGLEVGVWDAGSALTSHQEFDTRARSIDNSKEVSLHASRVTGHLISSGIKPNAKGVAYGAEVLSHDWTRDKIEVAEAAANGLLLSNHSYGIKSDRVPDWYFGSYIKVSQDWDKIMYNAPYYLMVSAAGNAQRSYDNASPNFGKTAEGFDLLLGFATSKNGLTIAGANTKIGNKGELKEANVTSYSSLGPIDDGRIKPDLAGDGSSIFSTSSSSNSSYDTSMGTSMATPGVTGSLLLLQQYHEELYGTYMKAATLKGLALHTADDVNAKGPDYKMGWGVMNAKTAAELLQNKDYSSLIHEENLSEGNTYELKIRANDSENLLVSISWTDPEGEFINRGDMNNSTPALINDLDVRITQNGKTYLPWKLNPANANDAATKGDNSVDPFERIEIANAKGNYTITISHKGMLKLGTQDFSLIVSGAQVTNCMANSPSDFELLVATEESATVSWTNTEDTFYEVQYKALNETAWQNETIWESNFELPNLKVGTTYQAKVRAICTENITSDFSDDIQFVFKGTETEIFVNEPFSFNEELQISVYPNPATDWLTLDAKLSADAVYSIITTSGNTIQSGGADASIDVSGLASGLYVLVVQDYSGIKSTKFYKN
ncbi:S8 family serine peptidase [Flagellimonas sp. S3867]|uniref:S8 family serine peptidase n=1 Tax=Flagellimonas sp. S3867 TaxID=2768063 RepID=UPI0016830E58|nr:S8 family serine peptidase [Flagellimonas sp. S3867]